MVAAALVVTTVLMVTAAATPLEIVPGGSGSSSSPDERFKQTFPFLHKNQGPGTNQESVCKIPSSPPS